MEKHGFKSLAEAHLYQMVEEIKKLNKKQLQESISACPFFKDAIQLANKVITHQSDEFQALVEEVAPMGSLSIDFEGLDLKIKKELSNGKEKEK